MRAVLFDMFGVIARVQSAESQAELERLAGVSGEQFWDAYWALRPLCDRGEVRASDYWRMVGERLGASFGADQVQSLIAADVASWSDVDHDVVDLLAKLDSGGITLGLLSNIPEELAVYYEGTQEWLDYFSVLGLSCRLGSAKPDPAAYEWCRRELMLPADQILFVDDRADNVLAAQALGMRGHVFTNVDALAAMLLEGPSQ